MTVGDRDELLSAYLDREVTPDERAEVEARLDASPDSRAELDALAELSLCLRTLDRPQAPADFQASVMQALAGRAVPMPPTPTPAATAPRRKSRREWLVTIIGIPLTACGLLLVVSMNWNSPNQIASGNKAVFMEDRSGAVDDLVLAPASMDGVSTYRESAAGSGGIARFSKTDGLGDEMKYNFPMAATADLKPAPAAETRHTEMATVADQPAASREIKETAGGTLDKVALLNQVLENWAATGAADQYVANIDVQVLDVRQTADTFQFLLFNNGVVTLPAQNMTTAKKADGEVKSNLPPSVSKNGTVTASGDLSLIAVYVDTTADRVTKSLEELAQQKRVLDVNQGPFLPFTRLAEEDVTLAKEQTESLKRAEVEDLTRLYVTHQWGDLNDSDMDLPVDALDVFRELGNAKSERQALNRARQFANPKMVAKAVPAAPVDAARTKDFNDNTTVINNSLNYSSVVKLQLESASATPLSDLTEALNTEGTSAKTLNTRADALQAGNTQRRIPQRQNSDYGTNSLANGRQRGAPYQNTANPVRVWVVFQDPSAEVKATNSLP